MQPVCCRITRSVVEATLADLRDFQQFSAETRSAVQRLSTSVSQRTENQATRAFLLECMASVTDDGASTGMSQRSSVSVQHLASFVRSLHGGVGQQINRPSSRTIRHLIAVAWSLDVEGSGTISMDNLARAYNVAKVRHSLHHAPLLPSCGSPAEEARCALQPGVCVVGVFSRRCVRKQAQVQLPVNFFGLVHCCLLCRSSMLGLCMSYIQLATCADQHNVCQARLEAADCVRSRPGTCRI